MAEILSKETKQVVYKTVRKLEGIKCDICGKVIPAKMRGRSSENRYFEVETGHNDCGDDSYESIEFKDICPGCISKFMTEYIEKVKGSEYIEVETTYCYPRDVTE